MQDKSNKKITFSDIKFLCDEASMALHSNQELQRDSHRDN
jgi:hypothetical protein